MLEPKVLDLSASVTGMQPMLKRLLGEDIELSLLVSLEPCRVHTDPSQVEQVIMNLAVNARDAMPNGGTLTITTHPRPGIHREPGISMFVRDTGIGMPSEILGDIFEPFFTTKSNDRGTGLGLATVREIAQRNNGRVGVTSTLGVGTLFEFWLPATTGVVYETTRLQAVVPAGRGESVLVVEDDPRVRDVTRRVLASGGYAVHDVRDAEEALAFVANVAVDVLVTDMELPGMSGIECAQRVVDRTPTAAVLYTSGMASDPRGRGGVRGAAFLAKPYTPAELMRSVRKTLEGRR
jgi:CheY-like chemotaxis protein